MTPACILVIEDEAHVRTLIQRILESAGLTVLPAEDGPSGIAVYEQHSSRIDLVLLDQTMPGLSGLQTLQELIRIRADVRAILMSGLLPEIPTPSPALVGIIQKPFRPTELLSVIEQALRP